MSDMQSIPENRARSQIANAFLIPLGGALLFGLLAYFSIELSRGDGRIAAVWVPNGVAVAYLMRVRVRYEPVFLAALYCGNLCANLAVGDSAVQAASLSLCNTVEIVIAALLVRKFCGHKPDMRRVSHLMYFVASAGIAAPIASACLAVSAIDIGPGVLVETWLKWATTDALGMILVAPTIMIIVDAAEHPRWPEPSEVAEWSLLTIAGTITTYLVFRQTEFPLLFLVTPVVVTHAFRLGSLGTAFSIMKVALIATIMTTLGHGPINLIEHSQTAELLVFQTFLASAFVMGLPVAAVLNGERRAVLKLARRQSHLKLLTDNITDAIVRYDINGICTYCSPSVHSVLGASPKEFLGKRASARMHPEAKKAISQAEARLLSGESTSERFTYRRYLDDDQGRPVFIEADAAIAIGSSTKKPEGIIVSARDVTHRVTLEHQLKRARKHAENAAVSKSQFLANMSHEIRTPMNGVLGFVDLLLRADLPKEQQRHAELIKESGDSMMALLNDILDISKIDAGEVMINHEPVDVGHVVMNCLKLHSANAESKGITLTSEMPGDFPQAVDCDPLRLRQIILNLLGNAIKFTESGTICLHVSRTGGEFTVAVEDTGIGIAPDRLNAIFNPFEQADNATSRRYGGTGLGLSISRKLATLLGGTLSATSEFGSGSRFSLTLPLVQSRAEAKKTERCSTADLRCQTIAPSRILLAEDHDINRILVTTMLEQCGQSVETAVNGQEAVSSIMAAKANGTPYDLVLMDVQMPEVDGYLATQTVRNLGVAPDELPIIALTANAFEEDISAAISAGMQAHLAKPLQYEKLVTMLQQWLPAISDLPEDGAPALSSDAGANEAPAAIAPTLAPPSSNISIADRWKVRRQEALDAVSEALRAGSFDGQASEDLARTCHKLAGTAGMFGEDELGKRASALERALKSADQAAERSRLAEDLLRAA